MVVQLHKQLKASALLQHSGCPHGTSILHSQRASWVVQLHTIVESKCIAGTLRLEHSGCPHGTDFLQSQRASWVVQLHKTVESREGEVEGLSQELKVNKAEVNRLQPLETRNMDLVGELKQIRADKDR